MRELSCFLVIILNCWIKNMCDVLDRVANKGRQEVVEIGKIQILADLVNDGEMTPEKAA